MYSTFKLALIALTLLVSLNNLLAVGMARGGNSRGGTRNGGAHRVSSGGFRQQFEDKTLSFDLPLR